MVLLLVIGIFFLFVAIQIERKRLQKKADCRLRANVASLCEKHKNLRRRPVKRRQPSREKREQNVKASGLPPRTLFSIIVYNDKSTI
jgi:hypothetical protein